MRNLQTRLKVKAKLKKIGHKPIRRGGNGRLLPLPQLALLHALGGSWQAELAILTKKKRGSGFPGCYKADIANKEKMIVIEVDGPSHSTIERRKADAKKVRLLTSLGWSVYRVSNERALQLYSTFKSVDILLTSLMAN